MNAFDPMEPPPESDDTIRVQRFRSPRWEGKVPSELEVSAWEWRWFSEIKPTKPRLYVNGNGGDDAKERPYVRFAETMPDRKSARPTLERYLQAMREYVIFRQGGRDEPERRGPPVGLIDGNCCNLRPGNRRRLPPDGRRHSYNAAWSVRIRVDAVFRGADPEEAWARETERQSERAAERAKAKAERAAEKARKAAERAARKPGSDGVNAPPKGH